MSTLHAVYIAYSVNDVIVYIVYTPYIVCNGRTPHIVYLYNVYAVYIVCNMYIVYIPWV